MFNRQRIFRCIALFISSCLLASCSHLPLIYVESDNYNDRIRYVVIHHTTIDYQDSIDALTRQGNNRVSSHYLIPESNDDSYDEDSLEIVQLVDEDKRAWHAGSSYWQGTKNLNDQSIGIELVYLSKCKRHQRKPIKHTGLNVDATDQRICFYPDFDQKQISLLIDLLRDISERYPDLSPTQIVGHSDIAPDRKVDPGPRFPWHQLYLAGFGAWYEQEKVTNYWQKFADHQPSVELIQLALSNYGYGIPVTGILDAKTRNTITAFQMHFRPWQVDGLPSSETVATLFALLDRYFPKKLERLLERYDNEVSYAAIPVNNKPVKNQLHWPYPEIDPSTRTLVNNRFQFFAKKDNAKLTISNTSAHSIEIDINGHSIGPINLKDLDSKILNIGRYVTSGTNRFTLTKVQPENAELTVSIPYPELSIPDTEVTDIRFTAVDKLIRKDVEQGFPGATLLVVHQGKVVKHSAYGYANRYDKHGQPLDTPETTSLNTLFDIASNTKMFATNLALMKLQSEGKLNVYLPLKHYIPEYKGDGRESRTVADLLNHSAGYPAAVDFHRKDNMFDESFFSQSAEKTKKLLIERVPFIQRKNLVTKYSDVDYMLLGVLVERITNMPLDTYVEKNIYQPLGLTHLKFNPLQKGVSVSQIAATELAGNTRAGTVLFDNVNTDVIRGVVHDEKASYAMEGVAGHAGLFSTAADLGVLAQLLLNQGGYGNKLWLDPNQIDQFTKPSTLEMTMGLGWRRAAHGQRRWSFGPWASNQAYGHTGWTGTATVIDPVHQLAIILLTNKKHSPYLVNNENVRFSGDTFETGRYGSVISLIYEAILNQQ